MTYSVYCFGYGDVTNCSWNQVIISSPSLGDGVIQASQALHDAGIVEEYSVDQYNIRFKILETSKEQVFWSFIREHAVKTISAAMINVEEGSLIDVLNQLKLASSFSEEQLDAVAEKELAFNQQLILTRESEAKGRAAFFAAMKDYDYATLNKLIESLSEIKLNPQDESELLSDRGAETLEVLLANNAWIKALDYSGQKIGDFGAKEFAVLIRTCTALEKLDLSYNRIESQGARFIADALKSTPCLRELNLSFNNIESAGAMAIADALAKNNTLRLINLKNNGFDKASMLRLASVLCQNHSLQSLNLKGSYHHMDDEVASAFLEGIRSCHTLEDFIFEEGEVSSEIVEEIHALLERNKSLPKEVILHQDVQADTSPLLHAEEQRHDDSAGQEMVVIEVVKGGILPKESSVDQDSGVNDETSLREKTEPTDFVALIAQRTGDQKPKRRHYSVTHPCCSNNILISYDGDDKRARQLAAMGQRLEWMHRTEGCCAGRRLQTFQSLTSKIFFLYAAVFLLAGVGFSGFGLVSEVMAGDPVTADIFLPAGGGVGAAAVFGFFGFMWRGCAKLTDEEEAETVEKLKSVADMEIAIALEENVPNVFVKMFLGGD